MLLGVLLRDFNLRKMLVSGEGRSPQRLESLEIVDRDQSQQVLDDSENGIQLTTLYPHLKPG